MSVIDEVKQMQATLEKLKKVQEGQLEELNKTQVEIEQIESKVGLLLRYMSEVQEHADNLYLSAQTGGANTDEVKTFLDNIGLKAPEQTTEEETEPEATAA